MASGIGGGKSIGSRVVRAGVFTGGSQVTTASLQIVSTVWLSRLLTPADFGLMAMAATITALATLFREFGLSTASIQKSDLSISQSNAIFWINVAIGTTLSLTVCMLAPVFAGFFARPELAPVLRLLSLSFVISSIAAQPNATLQRRMQFGKKAGADVSLALVTTTVSVLLAQEGFGVYSIVCGMLSGLAAHCMLVVLLSGFRPNFSRPDGSIATIFGFGANVTAFEIFNYLARNLDNIVLGRFSGASELGFYNRAYQLLMFPISNLRAPLASVAFASLSRVAEQPDAFRLYYRRFTGILAMLSMPLSAFLFVFAEPVILILLGAQWLKTVPIFRLLALVSFIQPVTSFRAVVVLSLGRSRLYLIQGAIVSVVTSLGFIVGVHWGAIGVAAAYVVSTYLLFIPTSSLCFNKTPVSLLDFLGCIAPFGIASCVAAVLTWAIQERFIATGELAMHGGWLWLAIVGVIYAVLYFSLCWLSRQARMIVGLKA